MLDGERRGRRPARRRPCASPAMNFGAYPTVERAHPTRQPLPRRAGPGRRSEGARRRGPRRGGRGGGGPRDVHSRRHRLGGRGADRDRGARRVLAGRAHRHGGLAALRRAGDAREQDLRAPLRVAELDLPAAQRGRAQGRAQACTAPASAATSTAGECDGEHRLHRADPQQREPRREPPAAARPRGLAAQVPRVVARHGTRRLPGQGRLPAHRHQRGRQGVGPVRLHPDARLSLGHLPRRARGRTARSTSASTRASPPGRRCPASTAGLSDG